MLPELPQLAITSPFVISSPSATRWLSRRRWAYTRCEPSGRRTIRWFPSARLGGPSARTNCSNLKNRSAFLPDRLLWSRSASCARTTVPFAAAKTGAPKLGKSSGGRRLDPEDSEIGLLWPSGEKTRSTPYVWPRKFVPWLGILVAGELKACHRPRTGAPTTSGLPRIIGTHRPRLTCSRTHVRHTDQCQTMNFADTRPDQLRITNGNNAIVSHSPA